MVLLIAASCLLFFITYFTGIATAKMLNRWLAINVAANFFETFILGLITSFIYFNLVSFVAPVNYIALLPLLATAIASFSRTTIRTDFCARVSQNLQFFFSKQKLLFVLSLLTLLFVYWIIPPLNWDSSQYHYISIRWFEKFKVIPGLANVHGRLAFNPANFIISAAYSFTDVAGQALYPLNGVLVCVFFLWLANKFFRHPGSLYSILVFIVFILLFRIALANISSPSSDLLSGLLLFYCGFRTYELIKEKKDAFGDYVPVLLIASFSVTAKLSAIPSLLLLPFIYFLLLKKDRKPAAAIKIVLAMAFIIAPWLARNFILCGYLLYPVPASNIFHADWAVPANVLKLDFIFSFYGPRTDSTDFFSTMKMGMPELFKTWFLYMYHSAKFSLLIAIAAIVSPFTWLFFYIRKKKISTPVLLLWCIYYCCVLVWFTNSPEHRFGLAYLALAIMLPLFELATNVSSTQKVPVVFLAATMFIISIYYAGSVVKSSNFYSFSLADCWLKPMRDKRYLMRNDLSSFPSLNLGHGVTLYFPDSNHECLNAPGPCMNWRYGTIEMRGNSIEDGFRSTKEEIEKYYRFINTKR